MGSKTLVLLGLVLAMVLLISSEVAAKELAETSNTIDTTKVAAEGTDVAAAVNDAKDGGYGGGRYGGRRGGYCRYGCCGRSYYRRGCRCCTYAGEKADAEPQANP